MHEEKQIMSVFESTFEALFAYILRRVADHSVAEKMLVETYQRFLDMPILEHGKELLTLYNLAFGVLKEKHAIVFGGDLWTDLALVEAEILRLRYFENLNSVEIGFVIGESAGKVDAMLYATLVKAQRLVKNQDINEHLQQLKQEQIVIVPEGTKYKCGQELFNDYYNAERDFVLPESEEEQVVEVAADKTKDFLAKPMSEEEKAQFGIPTAIPTEEYWVPEEKESALPKENQMGYGMDLLKTFMKKGGEEDIQPNEDHLPEPAFKPFYDIPESQAALEENVSNDVSYEESNEEVGAKEWRLWRHRSWLAPICAALIVVAFLWLTPVPVITDVDKFSQNYTVTYSDNITFEEKSDLVEKVLQTLAGNRDIASLEITKLTEKNFQIRFNLKEGADKVAEEFVFYKMDDGRWAPRKYQAIDK